jgi:hypothetical protein
MKLIFAPILFVSCALAADAGPVASACGPDAVRFDVSTKEPAPSGLKAEPGKALVYVVEDAMDARVTSRIGLDGAWVGANHRDSWLAFQAEPGEHHLCANWQPGSNNEGYPPAKVTSLSNFTAEAGKVYYFRVRFRSAGSLGDNWMFFFDLEPMNSDEGRFLVASYPFSTSHPKK